MAFNVEPGCYTIIVSQKSIDGNFYQKYLHRKIVDISFAESWKFLLNAFLKESRVVYRRFKLFEPRSKKRGRGAIFWLIR